MKIKTPWKHQVEAAEYAQVVTHPALLMEMRLGKTKVAVEEIKRRFQSGAGVVAAPKTVLAAWVDELEEQGEQYVFLSGTRAEKLKMMQGLVNFPTRVWVLCNYMEIVKCPEIATMLWNWAIADESTKLKGAKSQTAEIFIHGFRITKCRMILTGSIRPENELNVFNQFCFLNGEFMGCHNYWQFRSKYFQPHPWEKSWIPKPGTQRLIKEAVHAIAFVMTRADAGMSKEKIYTKRIVEMTPEQRDLQLQIAKEWAYKDKDGNWVETAYAPVKHQWMGRIAGGFHPDGERLMSNAKAMEIVDLLKGELEGNQIVVWFRHIAEIDHVYEELTKRKFKCMKIKGGSGSHEGQTELEYRLDTIKRFRAGHFQVLLCMEKVAQYGIDCSTATAAIYYSNEYSGEVRTQSEDRILHLSKEEPLLYIDLLTDNSLDLDTYQDILAKTADSRMFMTSFSRFLARIQQEAA